MLGPPASGTSRPLTKTSVLRTTLSLPTPVDTSPAPFLPISSSVPLTLNTNTNERLKHYHDNYARSMLTLSHSSQKSSPGNPPGKVLSRGCTSNFKLAAGSRLIASLATHWLSGTSSSRIINWNITRWRSQLLLICAHNKNHLTEGTTGQCEIMIENWRLIRSLKTNIVVVQPFPRQCLSPEWDHLSGELFQRWRHPTHIRQQLKKAHQQWWSLIGRQPPYFRFPLVFSPLHYQQSHVKWGCQGELISRGHSKIRGCSESTTWRIFSPPTTTFTSFFFFIRHDERRGSQAVTWWIYNFIH